MNDKLERRQAYVNLPNEKIEQLISPLGFELESAAILTSGKLNTNFKIVRKGGAGPLVLRIYTNDFAACERDKAILDLVGGQVPIAKMLYHSVDESVLSYPYAMFEWVDGVLVSEALREGDEADVESIARAAGRTLAAVNQFEFPQPGFLGASLDYTLKCDSSTDSFRKYLTTVEEHGRAAQRVGAAKFRDMIKFVDENLSCLSITEDWCSLVHADYTGTNLITGKKKGSWVVHAVLDWEFAMAGSSIFDIGVFLRIEDEFGLGFREGFIESFLEWGGHLPSGWRRASKMLDLLNQFAFLDAEGVFPHTFLEAETRIRGTMNRWREFKD